MQPAGWLRHWLACADSPNSADMIFALAGRQERKTYALELFEQGFAPRLLLSVARFEIRRFAKLSLPVAIDLVPLASPIPPPQRHFFINFDKESYEVERIPVRSFGTLGEIEGLASWLARRGQIRSLLIISSGAHLRRVRMCCRVLLPRRLELRFLASPTKKTIGDGPPEPSLYPELLKLPLYRILLSVRRAEAATEEAK
jgi:hypothetical protein